MEKLLNKYNHFSDVKQKKILKYVQVYSFTVFVSMGSILLVYMLEIFIGKSSPFLFSLAAVAFIAWYGGFPAGIAGSLLIAAGSTVFLNNFAITNIHNLFSLGIFIIEGIFVSYLFQQTRNTKELRELRIKEKEFTELILAQKEAYEKAKAEIRSRDEFLSIASHELKTPLTSMLLKLQTALRSIRTVSLANFSVEKLMNMLESSEQQTIRLSKMINDLLNVSLITTGRIDLDEEEFDLKNVVESIIERFSEKLKQEEIPLTFEAKGRAVGTWDKIRLEQAISNLLSNAIKYGDNKPIHISLQKDPEHVRLIVRDEGIGISNENQKRIFSLFERGVSAKEYKGLGVGLYITNQIIKVHKGILSVESDEGKGSKFIIELPIRTL